MPILTHRSLLRLITADAITASSAISAEEEDLLALALAVGVVLTPAAERTSR